MRGPSQASRSLLMPSQEDCKDTATLATVCHPCKPLAKAVAGCENLGQTCGALIKAVNHLHTAKTPCIGDKVIAAKNTFVDVMIILRKVSPFALCRFLCLPHGRSRSAKMYMRYLVRSSRNIPGSPPGFAAWTRRMSTFSCSDWTASG